ncbi:phosphoribosylformylglycinamidine synthase [Candidatus Daviesbacteria bacterium]|nr:phosphoribosylformylglycinamidine synthase [Candidatus Daviesbacteria bacterium]
MIQKVRVQTSGQQNIKVYRLEGISEKEAKILAEKLLAEKINQKYSINQPITHLGGVKAHPPGGLGGVTTVEISYKPGVMNPEVASIMKAASDLGIKLLAADTSVEYTNNTPIFNPLTEHIVTEEPKTLILEGKTGKTKIIPIRNCSDEELMELSKDKLFLNLEEMRTIQKYFQKMEKDPTDLELETLAQTWSEHSGHKTFKAGLIVDGKKKEPLIKRIKKEALKHNKNIVSAFDDNSGVMDFYDGFAICGKVETHNAPSAIEPYGGAMTGSGGVFRDIAGTGKGAKNIASTDIFCFAPLDLKDKDLPAGCLPPKYLLKRVVEGVRDYGNRMGIPTNNGSVHFHQNFRARPSVIVGAYGILPKKYAKKDKPEKGDLIIVVGGRTGRDGIHGATFSSGEMTDKTKEVNASAVQIGNAIEEKRMFDALLEARDEGLIRLIQDVGGGGFSSAVGEIGEELGVSVDMSKAPLKYHGLAPWEIWVSESQERMVVVLERKNLKAFELICKKYNVEYALLGEFDDSKKLKVTFNNKVVCDLDMEFLHHGLPKKILIAKNIKSHPERAKRVEGSVPKNEKEWIKEINKIVSDGNVCSKEPIVRMYDHSVQGTNDLQPFSGVSLDGPNDSPVLRPFLDKKYGVVISHGLNPSFNNIDPYWGSIWAGAEALSNFVAVGGDYKNASLINNYICPFPDEETIWATDQMVDAVVDLMKAFKIPVISGKDSLSSTYRGSDGTIIKIPPTLCMSVFGKIPDASKTVTADFKKTGSTIVLVGKVDNKNVVPKVDLKLLPKTFEAIYQGIQKNKILSCHDVSEGGVITAIFEMCVGGNMGVVIDTWEVSKPTSQVESLFNETAGTFIVEVKDEQVAKQLFSKMPFKILGKTQEEAMINLDKLFNVAVRDLKKTWQKPMRRLFHET